MTKIKRIGFQGIEGAYGHQALINFMNSNFTSCPFPTSQDLFHALEKNEIDLGFIPVENSIVGNVSINTDLLYQYGFYAIAEHFHKISHCLLAPPFLKLENIKKVYSHPIALAQCDLFLKKHHILGIPDYDTAGAAKKISQEATKDSAAICSEICGPLYSLKILSKDIQNTYVNYTRFLMFKKSLVKKNEEVEDKVILAFETEHKSGALLRVLQTFGSFRLNLTKIESRPKPDDPFSYIFFLELDGELHDPVYQECLSILKTQVAKIKILGSFKKGLLPS